MLRCCWLQLSLLRKRMVMLRRKRLRTQFTGGMRLARLTLRMSRRRTERQRTFNGCELGVGVSRLFGHETRPARCDWAARGAGSWEKWWKISLVEVCTTLISTARPQIRNKYAKRNSYLQIYRIDLACPELNSKSWWWSNRVVKLGLFSTFVVFQRVGWATLESSSGSCTTKYY
jgi:hypothetical protein